MILYANSPPPHRGNFLQQQQRFLGVDGDDNSWQEGKNGLAGNPTYAMVTSRSFHPNIVHTAMSDRSVQTFHNEIGLSVWSALATRAGEEIM